MKININIKEIVLDGFYNNNIKNTISERKIVLAIEEELTRMFKEKDYMDLYKKNLNTKKNLENSDAISRVYAPKNKKMNSGEISVVDAGGIDISRNINHDKIGIQIARSIYQTWRDSDIGNINTKKQAI